MMTRVLFFALCFISISTISTSVSAAEYNRPTKRSIITLQKENNIIIKNTTSDVFTKRESATTGYTGRFLLQESSSTRLSTRSLHRRQAVLGRNGVYNNSMLGRKAMTKKFFGSPVIRSRRSL